MRRPVIHLRNLFGKAVNPQFPGIDALFPYFAQRVLLKQIVARGCLSDALLDCAHIAANSAMWPLVHRLKSRISRRLAFLFPVMGGMTLQIGGCEHDAIGDFRIGCIAVPTIWIRRAES